MAVTDKEYAILSNAVYRDGNDLNPNNYGFTQIDSFSSDEHGTYAVAYKNKDNEVVIAFRGTDNNLNKLHDVQYCNNGAIPPEFKDALQFYNDVKRKCENGRYEGYSPKELSIVGMTGHSLGGGMVQYTNAKLAAEQNHQVQGVAFAPLGAGNLFPEGFDAQSIKVRNYRHDGDLVPKITRQLGNEMIILPSKNLGYEVKYTPGVGNEIFTHYDDSRLAQHKMVGYMVDVGQIQTRTYNETASAEIKPQNSNLDPNNMVELALARVNTAVAVSDLPRNPHSKVLFDAYTKEALHNNEGCWTAEMNKTIAENMLKNGVQPQRVEQALKHSPEPVEKPYYFVKDIKNSPDLQVAQQARGRGIC